jgi:hypothetical protein
MALIGDSHDDPQPGGPGPGTAPGTEATFRIAPPVRAAPPAVRRWLAPRPAVLSKCLPLRCGPGGGGGALAQRGRAGRGPAVPW